MQVHERLHALRTHFGLSQMAMAKKLGYKSNSGYSMLETGANALGDDKIIILEASMNVNKEWLLAGEGPMILPDPGKISDADNSNEEINKGGSEKGVTRETINKPSKTTELMTDYLIETNKRLLSLIEKQQDSIDVLSRKIPDSMGEKKYKRAANG